MRQIIKGLFVLTSLLLVPTSSYAQASIAGVVRDTSGAVMPGVTVEAASPALIEKVRSVVSDGEGLYKIVDLRPGAYTVTFSLAGFNTVKRDGIELAGSFVATVNAEMRVGSLEETITVSGASPIVDVQSTAQQKVLSKDVMDAIPSSRTHFSLALLVPAMSTSNTGDLGGSNAVNLSFLTTHGGRTTDQRVMIDGLSTNNAEGASQHSGFLPNMSSTQEVAIDYAAGGAEMQTGGVQVNMIPREGGNSFRGVMFASGMSGKSMAGSNYDDDLKARGLAVPNDIVKLWDINPGGGGPLKKDKLWIYAAARRNGEQVYTGGFGNANRGNANSWTYVPNDVRAYNYHLQTSLNGRITWQINPKNKFSAFYDQQLRCMCANSGTATSSPEATTDLHYPFTNFTTMTWSSPVTNRLLFEAGASHHPERWQSVSQRDREDGTGPITNLIGVTDQASGRTYRGLTGPYSETLTVVSWVRASMSYVTGSHAFKVGFANQHATRSLGSYFNAENLSYRFNAGVPNQITQRTNPLLIEENIGMDMGIFAQDKWTFGKLTANLGVRYDHFDDYFPEQHLGPSTYTPTRDITFPKTDWVSWNDIMPRVGVVYDVFGNGKTAIKGSVNKYMLGLGLQGIFGDGQNPINLLPTNTTRTWNDNFYPVGDPRRGNFSPDCDLASPAANLECGAMADQNFGKNIRSASVDPDILRGWGKRGYNWEYSAGIQHELLANVSTDVAYFRRQYGNFVAIDNRATTLADYTKFSITAPVDSRLPDGGGYVIDNLYDLNPNKVGQIDSYYTFSSNFGKELEYWQGLDFGVNTRFGRGIILQGGLSTGQTVSDNCEVLAVSPEIQSGLPVVLATSQINLATTPVAIPRCHSATGFLTQIKGSGSYTIPKIDLQTSVAFQSFPANGMAIASGVRSIITANYVATNAVIAPSLGRNLSTSANATVNLVDAGALRAERINSFDVRLSKILNFGRTKTALNFDIFNAFNANPVLTENANYASWRAPLSILQARFVKVGVQFDF